MFGLFLVTSHVIFTTIMLKISVGGEKLQQSFVFSEMARSFTYCRTGFDSDGLMATKIALSLEFAVEIMPIAPHIGVVFLFM